MLWQGVPAEWKPWKVLAGDLDGDGLSEIVVAVYKPTRLFPEPHNCVFVYGWDGSTAYPKWLGSHLSKPCVDVALWRREGRCSLVSVEIARSGKSVVGVYEWCGFGFVGYWQSGEMEQGALDTAADGRVVYAERSGKRYTLKEADGSYRLALQTS